MVIICGLCSTTKQKTPQNDCMYALAATRDRLHQCICYGHIWPSAGPWCPCMCPSWGKWMWYSLTMEWSSMVHTSVRCCCLKSYYLSCVRTVTSSLSSSKAILLLIACTTQSTFWNERHLRSFQQTFGHPTAQIWTQLATKYSDKCSSELPSSWHQWTEAVLDRCLVWVSSKASSMTVHQWRICLCPCIRVKGGHFEHLI